MKHQRNLDDFLGRIVTAPNPRPVTTWEEPSKRVIGTIEGYISFKKAWYNLAKLECST